MATITGLRLTQLNILSLGSTGTMFYAVSAGNNVFRIYEKDLYATLNTLHISGNYQPKFEDWRFVHTSGTEYITGVKRFVSATYTDLLRSNTTNNNAASIINCQLLTGGNSAFAWGTDKAMWNVTGGKVLNWQNQTLLLGDSNSSNSTITLDWSGRNLSGNWNKNGNYILTSIDSGNILLGSPEATGIALHNQIVGLSGNLVNTGANLYSYITNFSGNFQSFITSITPTGSGSYRINYPLGSFASSPRIYCTVEISGDTMYSVNITGRNPTGFWALFSNTIAQSGVTLHTFASLNS